MPRFSLAQVISFGVLIAGIAGSYAVVTSTTNSNSIRIERLEKDVWNLRERLATDEEKIADQLDDIHELEREHRSRR